jgi:hypothetical protein
MHWVLSGLEVVVIVLLVAGVAATIVSCLRA